MNRYAYKDWFNILQQTALHRERLGLPLREGAERAGALAAIHNRSKTIDEQLDAVVLALRPYEYRLTLWDGSIG